MESTKQSMDSFEKLVRRCCCIVIVFLSIYIGIKIVPFLPKPIQVQISSTVNKCTEFVMKKYSLLEGYFLEKPKYPETMQELVVELFDKPLGIYEYMSSQEETSEDTTQESTKEVFVYESLGNVLDFQYLIKNFYVVDGSTSVTEQVLNPSALLSKDVGITKKSENPQILIYHTHSQETFADSVQGDASQTIIGVGNYLTEILTNQYGYNVLHHTGVYDMENGKLERSGAYNRALPAIEAILKQYPSIEVVIDLHRDGVPENVHLVTEVNGKKVARLMFFNGICRDTNGELVELSNPYREDNLAFSLQMGLQLKSKYPQVFRTLYLQKNRYNQHISNRCLLVETGAQTNTLEEAMNAMEILAEILNDVLS